MRFFAIDAAAELLGINRNTLTKRIKRAPALLKAGVIRIERGAFMVDVHEMALRFPDLKQNPMGGNPRGPKPKPKIKPETPKSQRKKKTVAGTGEAVQRAATVEPSDREVESAMDYTTARAAKEKWNARAAKMNYQREMGKLIPADAVVKGWIDIATLTQKSLLSVPDRIAPLLVGETDQAIIHKRMTDEIRYALKNLSFTLAGSSETPKPKEPDAQSLPDRLPS